MRGQAVDGEDLERAIGWARAILAGVAVVLIVGTAASDETGIVDLGPPLTSAAVVAITAAAMTLCGRLLPRHGAGSSWLLQAAEVTWSVVVATRLAEEVPQVAWAVLVFPIVTASLRLGAVAVVASALIAGLAYEAAITSTEASNRWGQGQESLERLAVLLAIAAALAVLARFLREAWRVQARATAATDARRRRLSTIEQAARAMRGVGPTEVIDLGLAALVELGFDAATSGQAVADRIDLSVGSAFRAAGDGSVVPVDSIVSLPNGPTVEVAEWDRPAGPTVYSAMARGTGDDLVFVGWSRSPIDEGLAVSLGDLVTTAMTALTAAIDVDRARPTIGHDALTGLVDRTELVRQVGAASEEGRSLVVVFVDVDRFRLVNDHHGHPVGDAVLIELAGRLRQLDGDRFTIARHDGDRFVVAADGLTRDQAAQLAEWIRRAVAAPFLVAGIEVHLSASLGVLWSDRIAERRDAIRLAGHAAEDAKQAGGNRIHVVRSTTPRPAMVAGRVLTG